MFAERLLCWWIGALGLAAGAFCQSYVEILPAPGVSTSTFPTGVNESGSVTGYYFSPYGNDIPDGFVRNAGGAITTFDSNFVFKSAYALAINGAGAITGNYFNDLQFDTGGFVRGPQGNVTYFDPPGSSISITAPTSINAGGVIAGYYFGYYGSSGRHGFVRYDNGTVISFDPPGSVQTTALSINSRGAVTGYYHEANNVVHGFVRRADGTIVTFDAPGSMGTFPASINDAGAITGYYTAPNGGTYGFVRDPHESFTSFDAGGYTFPASINKEGAITGFYSNVSHPGPKEGISRGFVRSPQGTITSFDPNDAEPTLCNPPPSSGSLVFPTSINREGVITGYCYYTPDPLLKPYLRVAQGWVRYP